MATEATNNNYKIMLKHSVTVPQVIKTENCEKRINNNKIKIIIEI